jgi:hypothetical protein
VTHEFLESPENARAFKILSDHPRGSTRAWAKELGWTSSKTERFLLRLKAAGLAIVRSTQKGSVFVPTVGVSDASRTRLAADVLDVRSNSLDVSRYDDLPKAKKPAATRPIADPDDVRLIRAANAVFADRKWDTISEDNFGSLKAAKKILAQVPVDRAIPLLESACRVFNPSKTGGDVPRSLGHPFFAKHVVGEWKRLQQQLASGQLSMLFVEDAQPPVPEYKPEPDGVTDPAVVSAVMLDLAAKMGVKR